MTYPWIMNDRFNAAFPNMRGMTINTPPPLPTPIPAADDPVKLDNNAYQAWRRGNPIPSPVNAPIPSAVPQGAFPVGGAAPISNAPAPVVEAGGPSGLTLNSAPPAAGWAGSVGLPQTPEQAKAFAGGENWNKLMSGLDEIKKGVKPTSGSSDLNTITPMSAGGVTAGGGSQLSASLLAQLLQHARGRYA